MLKHQYQLRKVTKILDEVMDSIRRDLSIVKVDKKGIRFRENTPLRSWKDLDPDVRNYLRCSLQNALERAGYHGCPQYMDKVSQLFTKIKRRG